MFKIVGAALTCSVIPLACASSDPSEDLGERSEAVMNGVAVDQNAPGTPAWVKRIVRISGAEGSCTGVLLTDEFALTAAHCVNPKVPVTVTHSPTGSTRSGFNHSWDHPEAVDIALIRVSSPINTGVPSIGIYQGNAGSYILEDMECFGYGWREVLRSTGSCTSTSQCPANHVCSPGFGGQPGICYRKCTGGCPSGYSCSGSSRGNWCYKAGDGLRKGFFEPNSIDPGTDRYVVYRRGGQLTLPGDSGGSCFDNGQVVAVNSGWSFDLTKTSQEHAEGFRDWVENRIACPVFDPTNGVDDICTPECPCDVGEGDCDTNADCQSPLVCKQYSATQAPHGLPNQVDICVDPSCPSFDPVNPNLNACMLSAGQADCDSDGDCGAQMHCSDDTAKALHPDALAWVDVCVNAPAPGCTHDVCSPSCPCDVGERGCSTDADCRVGLVCGANMGGYVGWSGHPNICVKPGAVQQGACTSNAQCPGGKCLSTGVCSEGEFGDWCTTSSDCDSGSCCRMGEFSEECSGAGACVCFGVCD